MQPRQRRGNCPGQRHHAGDAEPGQPCRLDPPAEDFERERRLKADENLPEIAGRRRCTISTAIPGRPAIARVVPGSLASRGTFTSRSSNRIMRYAAGAATLAQVWRHALPERCRCRNACNAGAGRIPQSGHPASRRTIRARRWSAPLRADSASNARQPRRRPPSRDVAALAAAATRRLSPLQTSLRDRSGRNATRPWPTHRHGR
jgi:hypothetical protein